MDKKTFQQIEKKMLEEMGSGDNAHEREHIYRVLDNAMIIAEEKINEIDLDVLIASCLLHDIGRRYEREDNSIEHSKKGAEIAYGFLISIGYSSDKAEAVKNAIKAHSFKKEEPPNTLEGKMLFDADKLDLMGTMGIARTFIYGASLDEPIYETDEEGNILDGKNEKGKSFLRQYHNRLKKTKDKLFTEKAKEIAIKRETIMDEFYDNLLIEVSDSKNKGNKILKEVIKEK